MPKLIFEVGVEMDGAAEPYSVVADQRDIARWEIQPFGCPVDQVESRMLLFLRYLAWSASRRQQLTDLDWPTFDDQCAEAMPLGDDEDGAGTPADAEDPGRPGQSD
jgi:hypothetical protein